MIIHLIQFISLFLLMLVTAVFFGPWFALHRKLNVFISEEFIHIVKTMAASLAVPMRILMPACILFMTLSVWFYPQKNSFNFYFILISLILMIISLIVTIVVEVPIVDQITKWTSSTIPSDWESTRNRWVKFHKVRMFAALLAFACFSISILFLEH